ncbi:hypothetical protein ACWPKO_12110 [Coraliomargarita sp. W4R53]
MPYNTTWLPHGIIWTYSGILTGEELLNSNFEIFGDERFDDIRYQIVDFTAVEKLEVTPNHMRKIAHLDMAAARTNPRVKVAAVASKDEEILICDIYDQYTGEKSPWAMQVFPTLAEAKAWAIAEIGA